MRKTYFTVGPSQIYPKLPKFLNQALKQDILSLSHRGSEFKQIFKDTTNNLKSLLNVPKDFEIFFVSSALEAMERTTQGLVEKNSFHIITGAFGKSWANIAKQLGKNPISFEFNTNFNVDFKSIEIPKKIELICITQNETSLGVWVPENDIYNLAKKYSNKLIAVDIVSSVPFVNLDFKYIDIAFFSVQKGFGLPSGLGIMIISPKALEKVEKLSKEGIGIGSFHNLKNLSEKAKDYQTPETPNLLNIYLLNQVAKDMLKIGIKKIREDTKEKSELLYDFFDSHKEYSPFINNPKFRSPTTLVIDVKGESEIIGKKLKKHGFVIASGYGDNKQNHIRIGNFPTHSLKDITLMLKYLL